MNNKKRKILTRERVKELGLDKLEVITSDMIEGYTTIGKNAFYECSSLKSITIPESITRIGENVFAYCHFST